MYGSDSANLYSYPHLALLTSTTYYHFSVYTSVGRYVMPKAKKKKSNEKMVIPRNQVDLNGYSPRVLVCNCDEKE